MAIDFGIHGFDYTRELCFAIERYTLSEVRRDSQAFVHRGMHLRHAVERDLYMQGVNSEGLFRHYLAHVSDVPGSLLPALTPVEKIIAFFLCNQRAEDDHPAREVGRRFLNTAKLAYRWIRHRVSRLGPAQIPIKRHSILINVCNLKFANYLAPVTNELALDSYAYLVLGNSVLSDQLLKKGLPVAYLPSKESFFGQIFCSNALSYFNHLTCAADAILGALSLFQPRCILVVEGNAPTDSITAEACRLLKTPCYCLQQGWSPYVHNGFRNMNYTEMLVWGNRFAEFLRQFNSSQVFRVTGSHALKIAHNSSVCTSVKTISFFLQSPCALLGVSAFNQFVDLIADVAGAYPNLKVIVREHPGYRLPVALADRLLCYSNVFFSLPADEPVAEVIARSDLVVSVFSSVLLEAMAMNVVPLICSIGSLQQYEPAIASLGAAIEVSTIDEASRMINQIIIHPEMLIPIRQAMARISEEFFSPGNAAKMIATLLNSTCNNMSCD